MIPISTARELAAEAGLEEISINRRSKVISFKKGKWRVNVYYTTGAVGTCIEHPKQGKTQLFRKFQSVEDLEKIFDNPRVHTGQGYQRKRRRSRSMSSKNKRKREKSINVGASMINDKINVGNPEKQLLGLLYCIVADHGGRLEIDQAFEKAQQLLDDQKQIGLKHRVGSQTWERRSFVKLAGEEVGLGIAARFEGNLALMKGQQPLSDGLSMHHDLIIGSKDAGPIINVARSLMEANKFGVSVSHQSEQSKKCAPVEQSVEIGFNCAINNTVTTKLVDIALTCDNSPGFYSLKLESEMAPKVCFRASECGSFSVVVKFTLECRGKRFVIARTVRNEAGDSALLRSLAARAPYERRKPVLPKWVQIVQDSQNEPRPKAQPRPLRDYPQKIYDPVLSESSAALLRPNEYKKHFHNLLWAEEAAQAEELARAGICDTEFKREKDNIWGATIAHAYTSALEKARVRRGDKVIAVFAGDHDGVAYSGTVL